MSRIPPDRNNNQHPALHLENNNQPIVRRRQAPAEASDIIHTILFDNFHNAVGESRQLFAEEAHNFSNETLRNAIEEEFNRFSNVLSQNIISDERTHYIDTQNTKNFLRHTILNFLTENLPQDLNQQIENNRPQNPIQATELVNRVIGDIWEDINLEALSHAILNSPAPHAIPE